MVLLELFRSFLPLRNPIGFGASDFIELALAALLLGLTLISRPWIEPYGSRFAQRTAWCMLLLAALPVALRLALLPNHPVPSPDLYDEFEGDRFSHACPFARIMEAGAAKRLIQVGIRTMNPHQKKQAARFGVEVDDGEIGDALAEGADDGQRDGMVAAEADGAQVVVE